MAVELKCPDCGSKLRLKLAPEPGTEIECPECTHVFGAPRLDDDAPVATKKKPSENGEAKRDGDKPKKKSDKKGMPKKKKVKKKETNPMVLVGVIVFGLLVLALVITLLWWFMSKKPAAYEMMNYLPEDTHSATGLNYSHIQKYPEFFKQCETTFSNKTFKKASDAFAKALGSDTNETLDYMLYGETTRGDIILLRTKKEYDTDAIGKIPGAKKQAADGKTYYTADIEGMTTFGNCRVVAITNRIVGFYASTIPDSNFRAAIKGLEGSDKSMNARSGGLGKRVMKGTWWGMRLFDTNPANKPSPPVQPKGSQTMPGDDNAVKEIAASTTSNAKGYGFKVSVGSRTMRLEVDVWMRDDEAANNLVTKFKDSDLAKSDDASVDPPRWWKNFVNGMGDKKIGNELFTNVGAKSSGEVFVLYSELDTKLMMTGLSSLVGKVVPTDQNFSAPMMNQGGAGVGPGGGGVGGAAGVAMPGPP
jgi:hypothetical protein